jgi:hypothetical protein
MPHDLEKIIEAKLTAIERQTRTGWTRALLPVVLVVVGWGISAEVRLHQHAQRFENLPPKWLKQKVESIEGKLGDIDQRLRAIEKRRKRP